LDFGNSPVRCDPYLISGFATPFREQGGLEWCEDLPTLLYDTLPLDFQETFFYMNGGAQEISGNQRA